MYYELIMNELSHEIHFVNVFFFILLSLDNFNYLLLSLFFGLFC